MDKLKNNWKRTPDHLRKPTVFVVGILIVLLSGAVGWLPGPGGIPIFLLGIAILASEFSWAHSLKTRIFEFGHFLVQLYRKNPVVVTLIIILSLSMSALIMYMFFLLYNKVAFYINIS